MRFRAIIAFTVLIMLAGLAAQGQNTAYRFNHIDYNEGLSNNQVNCIYKDKGGFLWFGTARGLNRYDGYSVQELKFVPGDTSTIPDNFIEAIEEAPYGIRVVTRGGIAIVQPENGTISRNEGQFLKQIGIAGVEIRKIVKGTGAKYWLIPKEPGLFSYTLGDHKAVKHKIKGMAAQSTIALLGEDKAGLLWLLSQDGTLYQYLPAKEKIIRTVTDHKVLYPGNYPRGGLMVDNDGDVWFYHGEGEFSGLFWYELKTNKFRHITSAGVSMRLTHNAVLGVVQDSDGILWVSTDHGGINLLNKQSGLVGSLTHLEDDPKSIRDNCIRSIYKDDTGMIWLGTFKNGVDYYHKNLFRFRHIKHHYADKLSLPFDDVSCFEEDDKGNLWIGTDGGGLIYFDRTQNSYKRFQHDPSDKKTLSSNVVVSLYLDKKNVLWIGTYQGGLNSYDGRVFTRYVHDPLRSSSIAEDNVWSIAEDHNNNLWIGTLSKGLDIFDRRKSEFVHYQNGPLSRIHSPYVSALLEDDKQNLWVGTAQGVYVVNLNTGQLTCYKQDSSNSKNSISQNNITCLYKDSKGRVWIGTWEGLNYFDPISQSFSVITTADGLSCNTIKSIEEDAAGNFWVATATGLSHLLTDTRANTLRFKCRNYEEEDGLQSREFTNGCSYKTRAGELIFGGSKGFNIFKPDSFSVNVVPPKVRIVSLNSINRNTLNNASRVKAVDAAIKIPFLSEIKLPWQENGIVLEFASLSFMHPRKSKYMYTLVGFDNDWITTDSKNRTVTYTNLDPGDYVFTVKAANNDGIWDQTPASLKITITPPVWRTTFAYIFYVVIILFGIYGSFQIYKRIVIEPERLRMKVLQERRDSERMHELDALKIKFFTNVSHEFRTPLTLIITPLEGILNNLADSELAKPLTLVHRNAKRLLNLVNQLLDFRKMEVSEFRLNLSEGNIIKCIRETVLAFSDLSEQNNIGFSFHSSLDVLEAQFDQDKLEKIIFNLLSNAFKFTPKGGSVSVSLALAYTSNENNVQRLEIKVKDTGIGIPHEKQEQIFERFFQHDLPKNIVNPGSGVGLALASEFVKLLGGTMAVHSEVGVGSTFTLSLPITEITALSTTYDAQLENIKVAHAKAEEDEADMNEGKPLLLLVEDNEDFRFYLKDNLKAMYNIYEAENGLEGWKKTFKLIPDLIVSDIMMPELNGLQLCAKIKNDIRTSHIPVILLTVQTSDEQKLSGYETGADDYITKPFNVEILQSRIRNLIARKKQIQGRSRNFLEISPSKMEISSLDQKLIAKAIKLVEQQMSNPDFSVIDLSRELGMSRGTIYKKLVALTGKSPIEFIRIIRLKRGAQLLRESQLSVAEIAYEVGFNTPRYFSEYFKAEFGLIPSEYKSSAAGKGMAGHDEKKVKSPLPSNFEQNF